MGRPQIQLSDEKILKLNELYWNDQSSESFIRKEMGLSVSVLKRHLFVTRMKFETWNDDRKFRLMVSVNPKQAREQYGKEAVDAYLNERANGGASGHKAAVPSTATASRRSEDGGLSDEVDGLAGKPELARKGNAGKAGKHTAGVAQSADVDEQAGASDQGKEEYKKGLNEGVSLVIRLVSDVMAGNMTGELTKLPENTPLHRLTSRVGDLVVSADNAKAVLSEKAKQAGIDGVRLVVAKVSEAMGNGAKPKPTGNEMLDNLLENVWELRQGAVSPRASEQPVKPRSETPPPDDAVALLDQLHKESMHYLAHQKVYDNHFDSIVKRLVRHTDIFKWLKK